MSLAGAGPVVLVGAGKMGGALLEGWLARGLPSASLSIADPAPPAECAALIARHGLTLNPVLADVADPAVVVLAVKPQIMDRVLGGLGDLVRPGTVFVSVAAGRTIASMAALLGQTVPIVRTIPNTPAAVGRAMTVACANAHVNDAQKALSTSLLEAVGAVAWVEDEALIDAVTAVSGSGPAYVFHLVECMARAGVAAGLPEALAEQIARATVEGAGELLHHSPLGPDELRRNVTSPGGTTAAALDILMGDGGLEDLMTRAIAAATRRSRELSG